VSKELLDSQEVAEARSSDQLVKLLFEELLELVKI